MPVPVHQWYTYGDPDGPQPGDVAVLEGSYGVSGRFLWTGLLGSSMGLRTAYRARYPTPAELAAYQLDPRAAYAPRSSGG